MATQKAKAFDPVKAHVAPEASWTVVSTDNPQNVLSTLRVEHDKARVYIACTDAALRNKLAAVIVNSLNKHCGSI